MITSPRMHLKCDWSKGWSQASSRPRLSRGRATALLRLLDDSFSLDGLNVFRACTPV